MIPALALYGVESRAQAMLAAPRSTAATHAAGGTQ